MVANSICYYQSKLLVLLLLHFRLQTSQLFTSFPFLHYSYKYKTPKLYNSTSICVHAALLQCTTIFKRLNNEIVSQQIYITIFAFRLSATAIAFLQINARIIQYSTTTNLSSSIYVKTANAHTLSKIWSQLRTV